MIISNDDIEFTGERFVPGKALGQIEVEHLHRYQAVLDIIKNKKVLDAACGTGYGSALMSSAAQNVTGIDISGDTIRHNQKSYADIKNLEFIEASIAELPFPDKSFDVIVSFETIEHVNEELQNSFLKEIQRCLKDDGILIMSSPDKRTYTDLTGLTNEFHVKEFYYDEFLKFLTKAFNYKKIYVQGEHELSGELISSYPYTSKDQIKILNNPNLNTDKNLYIIAVCSNKALSKDISLSSLYPNIVSPRAFLYLDGKYTDKNMLIPEQFSQENGIVSAYFNLKGRTTEGKIRFDPMENFACQVEIIDIDTDANNINIAGLNEKEKINNSYIFMDTDPNMEITGDFLSATYIRLNYHISTLSVSQITNYFTRDLQEKEIQLNAKEEHISKLTLDYNAVKWEAQHYKKDLDTVTKQLIQTRNELTKQLIQTRNELTEQLIQTQKELTDYQNTLLCKITMKIKNIFN